MRKFLRKSRQKKLFSREIHLLLDVIAVVLVWRGTWNLIDLYLLPDSGALSAIVGLALGVFILFIDNYSFDELKR